jgi:F0F1-type ATP synthase membrane subunit c/vacuolar-type H+-ATPase subunit K
MVGLLLAVLAVSPGGWGNSLDSWIHVIGDVGIYIVVGVACLTAGVAVGVFFHRTTKGSGVSAEGFEAEFHRLIFSEAVRVVKVFGYTQETMSDYLRFDHRKRAVTMRVLNRSWLAEKADELDYNHAHAAQGARPWRKSRAIRAGAKRLAPSGPLTREIRYYDGPPIIKAIIFCSGSSPLEAFVSFYRWEPLPYDGGSPYKGADLSMLHLRSADDHEAAVMSYLESQFDREWELAKSAEKLQAAPLSSELPPGRNDQPDSDATGTDRRRNSTTRSVKRSSS